MTNRPRRNWEAEDRPRQRAEGPSPASHSLYADLCALENLQQAYTHVKENSRELEIDPSTLEAIEAEGVETFLKQLSNDLRTQTYKPAQLAQQPPATRIAEREGAVALRDLVVQAALKRLLEPIFPSAFPSDSEPEKTIKRLAGNIDKGFSRVYAMTVNECLDAGWHERPVERASRRISDPQLIGLLKEILAAAAQPDHSQQGLLTPLLADIALEDIDPILQQARALGREENFLHVHCRRVANEVVILLDQDARYDWLLPAVQKRLREELSNLHYDLAAVETQSVDLTRGGQLRFLDFELRLVKGKGGEARVQYRPLEGSRRQSQKALPRRRRQGRYHPLRFAQPCSNWIGRQRSWQLLHEAYRKANSIQVSWSHLPIALYPVLLFFFGWRSPVAWLCLASIFVFNWRKTLSIGRSVGTWSRRHKLDVVMGTCALAALVCLYLVVSELHAHLSREVAMPTLPPGFSLGQYNKGSPWDAELVPYGLYVPPHFKGEKGPFPLIVFLHGYGERTKGTIFKAGLPRSIANRFGPKNPNGPFEFVAFFPIDPTGPWQTGSTAVEDAITVLDYVIERHRIDPARIYLTGLSLGGNGVWNLAQAYPDKWAAVAPVSAFISPDVQKVRHLPAWIFHGARDKQAPVERERILVQQLQEAKADIRYTEVPKKGHIIWQEAYDAKKLYDWLATKKRQD